MLRWVRRNATVFVPFLFVFVLNLIALGRFLIVFGAFLHSSYGGPAKTLTAIPGLGTRDWGLGRTAACVGPWLVARGSRLPFSPARAQRTQGTALTSAECAYQGSLSPQRARRAQPATAGPWPCQGEQPEWGTATAT